MFAYQLDAEAYAVSSRSTATRTKPARAAYSPRHEQRRSRPGSLTNRSQGRHHKRYGL